MRVILFILLTSLFIFPLPAFAYVGPGLGLGALGVVIGVVVSFFLAIVGLIWYPLKRLYKKIRKIKR
jgi:hypothetical protein